MRVVYKKTILDEIREAVNRACGLGREIEKIVLTKKEAASLRAETPYEIPDAFAHYAFGVKLEVEN